MDAGRQIRKFPGYTLGELKVRVAKINAKEAMLKIAMQAEINRREAGFYSNLETPQIKG